MAAVAGVCGTLLAWWGVDVFARTSPASDRKWPEQLPRDWQPRRAGARSGRVAVRARRRPEHDAACARSCRRSRRRVSSSSTALKEDNRGGGRRGRALSILVVTEVAIACLLLTASGAADRELRALQGRRTGFVSDNVLTFWVRPPARDIRWRLVRPPSIAC